MKRILTIIINLILENLRKLPYFTLGILPFILNFKNKNSYEIINCSQLLKKKKSDVVFICGTGPSIRNIKNETWRKIERYDVISFRDFHKLKKVNVDFHISGEVDNLKEYAKNINNNPMYKNAFLIIQEGFKATKGNSLVGRKLLNLNFKIFRYKRKWRGKYIKPSKNFKNGVAHGFNSLTSAINIAYIMGWKVIILVGVDMHTHNYFYNTLNKLRDGEKKGIKINTPYTNRAKTLKLISIWVKEFERYKVKLFIFSERSYLRKVLPLFNWAAIKKSS